MSPSYEYKGFVVTLFMGSLSGSELLSYDPLKWDPCKTLVGADVRLIKAQANGREVEILQLKLKQPKTSRTSPIQVVELSSYAPLKLTMLGERAGKPP